MVPVVNVSGLSAGPGPKVFDVLLATIREFKRNKSCIHFEAKLDCLDCAACCGPAFDVVEVSQRDPVRKLQPDWITKTDGRFHV